MIVYSVSSDSTVAFPAITCILGEFPEKHDTRARQRRWKITYQSNLGRSEIASSIETALCGAIPLSVRTGTNSRCPDGSLNVSASLTSKS